MSCSTSVWSAKVSYSNRGVVTETYLTDRYVVGIWFCLDRKTGELLWESPPWRDAERVERLIGMDAGVLVAARCYSHEVAADFLYGVSVADGGLLWSTPKLSTMKWGVYLSAWFQAPCLEEHLLPVKTVRVEENRVITVTGRTFDLQSGKRAGKIPLSQQPFFGEKPGWVRTKRAPNVGESLRAVAEDRHGRLELKEESYSFHLTYYSRSIEA